MNDVSYATPAIPRRFSKAALVSFICGLLLCVPLVTGIVAVLVGILGWRQAGKPGMKGRWMAVVGILLGLVGIGGWVVFGSGIALAWHVGGSVAAAVRAPADATHDFIAALVRGDDAEAKKHSALSDADFAQAKAMVQAQGDFIDTSFNSFGVDEGGGGHATGTAQFKARTLQVHAELSEGPEGWRVTSIELLP